MFLPRQNDFAMLRPSHETNAGDVGFTNTSLTMTKSKLNRVTIKTMDDEIGRSKVHFPGTLAKRVVLQYDEQIPHGGVWK